MVLALAAMPVSGGTATQRLARPSESAFALPIEEIVLANGFRLLLLNRPGQSTVAAGWVVETGSFDDPSGAAGMSHLLEHLLFKGTRSIGTRSWEQERSVLARVDRLVEKLRKAEKRQKKTAIRKELDAARAQATSLARLGELSLLYSEAGAIGLNAHTFKDFATYLVTVPTEKLELWFWLESDRLSQPVLREFHKEIGVVLEERRQRIQSVPGAVEDAAFEERFWGASGYAHKPLGRPEELRSITRAQASAFFERWFQSPRLTAVLVGSLNTERVRRLAESYFGRLGDAAPRVLEARPTAPASSSAEPWRTECACATGLRVLYPAVPFGHQDSYALQVLAGILNGRAGRLHRSLAIDQEIARSAVARFQSYRHAGLFGVTVDSKGGHTPERLLSAWDRQVTRLLEQPVDEAEVVRVRNQMAAGAFRRLQDPANLRTQLLVYAGLGNWREISEGPGRILRVTADDVQGVAARYLGTEQRSVAFIDGGSP